MTYNDIIDLFRQHTTTWNLLFNQFEYISPGEYSRNTNLLYPLVSFERCLFGTFDTESITYKIALVFSDRSVEGLETEIPILSRLLNSTQIYMTNFISTYDPIAISNISFLTDQEAGNDRTYLVRVEFDFTVMLPSCEELLLNYTPLDCTNTPPPVCDVELENYSVAINGRAIEHTIDFLSIIGIDYVEIASRTTLSPYVVINTIPGNLITLNNIVSTTAYPLITNEDYFFQVRWYDLCGNTGFLQFGPLFIP